MTCSARLQTAKIHSDNMTEISKVKNLLKIMVPQARKEVQRWRKPNSEQIHCHKRMVHSTYSLFIGTLLIAFSYNKRSTARIRFSPASWLLISWGFEAILSQLFGKPRVCIRTFNVVQRASPVRLVCAHGDEHELYRYFHEGLATPYDVTPEGSTLLHVRSDFLFCFYPS